MPRKRKLITIIVSLLSGAFLLTLITAWIASGQITSPPRRTLQNYHQAILNHPPKLGIEIITAFSQESRCPYLIIEPRGKISPRGKIIRAQVDPQKLHPFGDIIGNIILFHGRKGRKEDLLSVAERFCAVGFRCILIDLPAHGDHSEQFTHYGAHSLDGFIAQKTLEEAAAQFKFTQQPAHLWGMSMGGAYANKNLLETQDSWKSAIIVCSFDTLANTIDAKLSVLPTIIKTPYRRLIHTFVKKRSGFDYHRAQPKKWAAHITRPVMIVHGTADSLISSNQGHGLYNSYQSQDKQWVEVLDAGHDNILITPMPLYAEMAEWLLTHSY